VSDDFPDPRRAERLVRAARAAHTLSETLWETLHEELSEGGSERVAGLSEQLGEVAATIASLARVDARGQESGALTPADTRVPEASVESASAAPGAPAEVVAPVAQEPHARARYDDRGEDDHDRPLAGEPLWPREPSTAQAPTAPAVLIDELASARSDPRPETTPESPRTPMPFESPHARAAPPLESPRPRPDRDPTAERPLSEGDPPRAGRRPSEDAPPRKARPQIEIRDVRGEEGPAAWIGSIGRRLERYEQDGSPFAVLLVELLDIERLRLAEPAEEFSRLTEVVAEALARELRPADSLTRERPGRYWLLAPRTDGPDAQVLAERVARAVRSSASHRGTPLEAAVGIAVCPEDGRRASELAAHADVGLYAARAAGRTQ
jgi:GGDEF domain-containing protein